MVCHFFLPALLRHDQQKIKNCENKKQGRDTQPRHPADARLHC